LKSSSYGFQESNAAKRVKTARKLANKELDMATLREIAVLNNLDEFIDVIDNIEEDTEIAVLTGPRLAKADSILYVPETKAEKAKKPEKHEENDLDKSLVQDSQNEFEKNQKSSSEVSGKSSTCIIL